MSHTVLSLEKCLIKCFLTVENSLHATWAYLKLFWCSLNIKIFLQVSSKYRRNNSTKVFGIINRKSSLNLLSRKNSLDLGFLNDDLIRADQFVVSEQRVFVTSIRRKSKIFGVNLLIVNYPSDFDLNVSLVVDSVVLFSYLLVTSNLMDKEWRVWRFSPDIRRMLKCSMLTFHFILTQLYFI